ncbi:MAG: FMN-binding protein [Candidatus Eisenbacteria bacterium]
MSELVHIDGVPRERPSPAEVARIAFNLTVVCLLGGVVLGGVYVGTERIEAAGRLAGERRALGELLSLREGEPLLVVEQSLDAAHDAVVYRASTWGDEHGAAREQAFTLDGTPRSSAPGEVRTLTPLGRMFVAGTPAAPRGFVLEGESRGYKNRIRFFVALDAQFTVCGVRVLEHEEDPGLGAEVATRAFLGQYLGRDSASIARLDVTRDPLPEDWRAALAALANTEPGPWQQAHAALLARESAQPVHAVTGATISSRALTSGVKRTIEHFRRRWALVRPWLEGTS